MGHKNTWDILNELITEFRRKGETIPPEVMADPTSRQNND